MTLHPDTFSPLGVSELTLRTKLYIWPNFHVIQYENFIVEVTECIPQLLTGNVELQDKFTKWGYGEAYYDVSLPLTQVVMDPACGYEIFYEAFTVNQLNELIPLSEVPEVSFMPENKLFQYSKCGPASQPDPDCEGTVVTKVIPIRIVARAGLYTIVESSPSEWIAFNIVFEPDCTKDTIYFNIPSDFSQVPYYITSPVGTPKLINPMFIQSIPECPVLCDLFENLERWDATKPTTIVTDFDILSA